MSDFEDYARMSPCGIANVPKTIMCCAMGLQCLLVKRTGYGPVGWLVGRDSICGSRTSAQLERLSMNQLVDAMGKARHEV